jgi:hypothetical protein
MSNVKPRTHRRAIALGTAAAGLAVWWAWPHHASGAADPSLVDGRVWVDSRPQKHTDYVHAAIFLSRANFGLFERASSYERRFEFFDMTRKGTAIQLTFPQTERSAAFTYSIRECSDHKPFDLCLTLSANPWGGPTDYYGFSQPEEERAELGDLARDLELRPPR